MDHPIQGLMTTAMQHLKQMTDVNTIVGDPIKAADGSVILPFQKLASDLRLVEVNLVK